MKEYFLLQFRMANRRLIAFGVPPFLGYILALIFFVGFSSHLFSNTEFASYVYVLLAIGLLIKLTDTKRNDFLKICFTQRGYIKVRLFENILLILPFSLILVCQNASFFILVLLLLAILLALVRFNTTFNVTIPTPFYKRPFEFTVGFRNTFFMFPIAYLLTYISISVGNSNLGVFSMLLVFMVSLSYYATLENEYYIWSFHLSAKEFLAQKIRTGLLCTSLLCLPILIPLLLFFNAEIDMFLIFLILGYGYLVTMILAKYSVYPNEMTIPQTIIIISSFAFPPLLIGVIPYFYSQSKNHLKTILP